MEFTLWQAKIMVPSMVTFIRETGQGKGCQRQLTMWYKDTFNLIAEYCRHFLQGLVPACTARFRVAFSRNSGRDLDILYQFGKVAAGRALCRIRRPTEEQRPLTFVEQNLEDA